MAREGKGEPRGRAPMLEDFARPGPLGEDPLYELALGLIRKRVTEGDVVTARWVLEQYGGKPSTSEMVVLSGDAVTRALGAVLPGYLPPEKCASLLKEFCDAVAPSKDDA